MVRGINLSCVGSWWSGIHLMFSVWSSLSSAASCAFSHSAASGKLRASCRVRGLGVVSCGLSPRSDAFVLRRTAVVLIAGSCVLV